MGGNILDFNELRRKFIREYAYVTGYEDGKTEGFELGINEGLKYAKAKQDTANILKICIYMKENGFPETKIITIASHAFNVSEDFVRECLLQLPE